MRPFRVLLGVAALAAVVPAFGHPPYVKVFAKQYRDLRNPIKALEDRCHVCHVGTDDERDQMNDYGRALLEVGLPTEHDSGESASKLAKKLPEFLEKVEPLPSRVEAKTFGDLIAAGELPGGDEVAALAAE